MVKETNVLGTKEWYANQIREIGEYLIKNAEGMVGEVNGRVGIDIHVRINPKEQTLVEITNLLISASGSTMRN